MGIDGDFVEGVSGGGSEAALRLVFSYSTSRHPYADIYVLITTAVHHILCSALACACYFLLRKKKVTKEIRPKQPALRETSAFNFAYASVQLASMLDEPQFTIHGELPLSKPKSEAGCTRYLKSLNSSGMNLNSCCLAGP